MKTFIKAIKTFLVLGILMVSTVALADYVGGGEWNYGVCWSRTCGYSDYFHPSNRHSSSVYDDKTGAGNKSYAGAGNWSKAKFFKIPPVGLSYYYNENE